MSSALPDALLHEIHRPENFSLLVFGLLGLLAVQDSTGEGRTKHGSTPRYPTYEGRVLCGYQGWFRAEGDGSGEGWTHYSERGPLTAATLHPDFWPDVKADLAWCAQRKVDYVPCVSGVQLVQHARAWAG